MVQVTGGMSVDPDDMTPSAIRALGGEVVTYGTPVLPGAMFMLSYVDGVPVVGLPGCVMYSKRSIYDLIVPRLLTGGKTLQKRFCPARPRGTVSELSGLYVSGLWIRPVTDGRLYGRIYTF